MRKNVIIDVSSEDSEVNKILNQKIIMLFSGKFPVKIIHRESIPSKEKELEKFNETLSECEVLISDNKDLIEED